MIIIRLNRKEEEERRRRREDYLQKRAVRAERKKRDEYDLAKRAAIELAGFDPNAKKRSRRAFKGSDRARLVALNIKYGFPLDDEKWELFFQAFPQKSKSQTRKELIEMRDTKALFDFDLLDQLPEEELRELVPSQQLA